MRFIAVSLLFFAAVLPASAQDTPPEQARVVPFLEMLDDAWTERQAFIEANMTDELIERVGTPRLLEITADLSEQLGAFRVEEVVHDDEAVQVLLHLVDEAAWVRLVLPLGPEPDFRIDGIAMSPAAPPPGAVPAATAETLPAVLSAYMAERAAEGFSGAVLVARRDELIYSGAFGPADVDAGEGNTLLTAFNIGSLNKMFTATVIAKLKERGELDWTDTVGKHLPDWPNQRVRDEVTIGHLLTHQSGLGAYWGEEHDARLESLDTLAEYADLFDEEAPEFTPGSRFEYSNNGYVLLGLIAERVTGKDYYTLVRELVYEPAGMTNSDHYRKDALSECCAVGYLRDGSSNQALLAMRGSPAGGGYATAPDLWRFSQAFRSGELVSAETRDLMVSPHAQVGPTQGYGFGFGVGEDAGIVRYGHTGGAPGISASLTVYPMTGYTIVVLSNVGNGARATNAMVRRIVLGTTR